MAQGTSPPPASRVAVATALALAAAVLAVPSTRLVLGSGVTRSQDLDHVAHCNDFPLPATVMSPG